MEFFELIFTRSRFRVIWHILFWMAILVYYTFYFGHQGGYYWFTFQFVVFMLPVAMGTTYVFNYFLIPRYLFTKKIFWFVLFSIYAIIVSFYLITIMIFPFLIISTNEVNFATLDKSLLDIYFLMVGMYTAILFAILIKLVKYSYERQHLHLQLLKDKTSAELEMLKSQINPHFLFNTLNNIYTLSLKKSDKTPEVVLKLSEMLDYLLYECNASAVPLNKEVVLIENYIYLQEIRFGHRVDISLAKEGNIAEYQIAPMLLLPFVENSFKHGVGKHRNRSWIQMKLSAINNHLEFMVKNSNMKDVKNQNSSTGGIGIANVKKRLQLLYPDRHQLDISTSQATYEVTLTIENDK